MPRISTVSVKIALISNELRMHWLSLILLLIEKGKLLRDKVTHDAATWYWVNTAKSRLRHTQVKKGYIEVANAEGVVVVNIHPKEPKDLFYLSEEFIGRLIGWFADELVAINIQFIPDGRTAVVHS